MGYSNWGKDKETFHNTVLFNTAGLCVRHITVGLLPREQITEI